MSLTKPNTPGIALAPAPTSSRPPVPAARRSELLAPARRFAARITNEWAPLLAWQVSRSGRVGLIGIGLTAASAVFLVSTHMQVVDESAALRTQLSQARANVPKLAPVASEAAQALHHLPARGDMPALLGVLLAQADNAKLALDTGKYDMALSKAGDITRYNVTFPVIGPYPQVRQFIDAVLVALPAVSITELNIERKTIVDGQVEARLRLTFYTRSAP
ncbi:MAG: type 4a pilus biogenesis protein PilO [Pseudomonadota bacterium]